MKIITVTPNRPQHRHYSRECFAKPGEAQDGNQAPDASINRRKTPIRTSKGHLSHGRVPVFYPGRTTTRDYVLAFLGDAGAKHLNMGALDTDLSRPITKARSMVVEENTDG